MRNFGFTVIRKDHSHIVDPQKDRVNKLEIQKYSKAIFAALKLHPKDTVPFVLRGIMPAKNAKPVAYSADVRVSPYLR